MNNNISAARKTSSLVRLWLTTGMPGTPLICVWVQTETNKLQPNPADAASDETGGMGRCA
jgi:hypothetical protein